MAFLGYSEDFDLDDDGILRDSADSGGILIDDDGIVRDDFDLLSKHGSSTHWTDSGLGGDKQSSTPSTLRQLDLQSYPSFEDVSHRLDESHVNISDLEASKDDLSFDVDENDREFYGDDNTLTKGNNRSGVSSRSSFNTSLNYEDPFATDKKNNEENQDLFGDEYYRQLQELGVLVDENDFVNPKDSLQEFETFEEQYSRDFDEERSRGLGGDFFREGGQTPTRDSVDTGLHDHGAGNKRNYYGETKEFDVSDNLDHSDRFDHSDGEYKRNRPNTASSTRTISSRSFPEISPEEALELYTERVQLIDNTDASSIDFEQSQKTVGDDDDDEIYFIPSQQSEGDSPKPAKIPAYDNENVPSMTPKSKDIKTRVPTPHSKDDSLDRSGSLTPRADTSYHGNQAGYHSPEDKFDSLTQVTRLESAQRKSEGDIFRPSSALSDRSAASESETARAANTQSPARTNLQKLSHAKSQESFFNMVEEEGGSKRAEKGPKRLLPKPGSGEVPVNQSFKVKSKSTTNIAAMGPVKPTHMSLTEIQHMMDNPEFDIQDHSEPKSTGSDIPKGELTKKLKQESTKRQQATQLVQQLQQDYDKLLSKYALAELTIDQLRLGAKITLHTNSPTPSQATSGSITSAQQLQLLQLTGAQKAMSASPMQAQNMFFPENQGQQDGSSVSSFQQHRGPSPGHPPMARSDSTNSMDSTSTPRGEMEPGDLTVADGAEKVKMGLMFQAKNLDERMESFQTLLGENQLNIQEQETVFDKIRSDHEKLRRDYLQSKEDYNVLRRSTAAGADVNFDQEKELEGELFRLGMKFDEIHETVDENLKEKSSARQPFQAGRSASTSNLDAPDENGHDPQTENIKKKITGTRAGNDLLEPKTDSQFDKKLKQLHEEYNALMDRYRRLKQMVNTPERDQEIDNLVRKLTEIADEEPDVFKLPQDVEDRARELKRQDRKLAAEKQNTDTLVAAKPKSPNKSRPKNSELHPKSSEHRKLPTQPGKSYEILTTSESWSLAESMDRWERSKEQAAASESVNRGRRSASPRGMTPRGQSHNESLGSTHSSVFENGYGADRSADVTGVDHDEPDTGLHSRRSNSYSSLSSRGRQSPSSRDSYQDRESPVPSLPRPRRHDYPDRDRRDRRELKKSLETLWESTSSIATDSGIASIGPSAFKPPPKPDIGSTTSLQDSGISEQEDGGGATGASNSPLSKLPGPGKFKQMTGKREHDTDSGFIGSMVGSEVSAGNLSSRRQPPQSPLRLRHPGDGPDSQRPSSRQSTHSEGSTRARTPVSVASSRSSRRSPHGTPTKAFPIKETKSREPEPQTERPVTKPKNQNRSRSRDQVTQSSRDYTDDSYTTVTESEMSFDSEARPKKLRSGSRSGSLRQIDKIVEDSEEERPSTTHSVRTNDSRRAGSNKKQTVTSTTKPKTVEQPKQQAKRGREIITDDITPTASPTRDTTQETYTSDETTPRSVIERERKKASGTRAKQPQVKAPASPRPVTGTDRHKPDTPRHAEAQVQQERRLELLQHDRQTLERMPPSLSQRGAMQREAITRGGVKEFKEIAVGSGSDETIIASDAETAATRGSRGSVNSQRLKLLSDELGKLREEFQKANQEKQHQPPPPPPAPVQPQPPRDQYYDQYFDPTEDPLAFMRGPRRRANSFSGHGGRDWDYDWTLPNVHRDGDIPLGYAAADSYADPRRRQMIEEQSADPTKTRGRQRLRHKIRQRNAGTQPAAEQNGYDSDQSPTRAVNEEPAQQRVQGHYGYYSPGPVQSDSNVPLQQTQTPAAPPQGRRVFGSQPNLAYSGYQPPPPMSTASGSTRSSRLSSARQHSPLRQTLYSYAASGPQRYSQRPYANDDIYVNDGQRVFVPHGASEVMSEGGVDPHRAVYTTRCPICGSESSHTHGDYVYPPTEDRPIGYLVPQHGRTMYVPVYASRHRPVRAPRPVPKLKPHLFPLYNVDLRPRPSYTFYPEENHRRGRPRRSRSKSATRVRHYSPDGRIASRYFVRQFGGESSASEDSDVEVRPRSRSVGRQRRMRRGRKYRRVRDEEYQNEQGSEGLARSNPHSELPEAQTTDPVPERQVPTQPDNETQTASPGTEADLETSLYLVGEIDELTKKMMHTVKGELSKYKGRKDFGSSVW